MIKKISFPKMQNRQLIFSPKIQYKLVAERSEAASNSLHFSKMWTILKLARTIFAACGRRGKAPKNLTLRRVL